MQSDPDSDSEVDISPEPAASGDVQDNTWKGGSDPELDSEGEEIMRDIA